MAKTDPLRVEVTSTLDFSKYFKKFGVEDEKSRAKVGMQALNWIANGSPWQSRVPPILTGLLTGSGSVFLGSTLIGFLPKKWGLGDPATSISEKKGVITLGFNTAYAAKWHEKRFTPGPVSQQRGGDVGYKFVESHLQSDGPGMLRFYAKLQKENVK